MTQRTTRQVKYNIQSDSKKIEELIAGMTLEEKAALCSGRDVWNTKSIRRLGIPDILMTDGPHGVRRQVSMHDNIGLFDSLPATCFPTASALAASWNPGLLEEVGIALADECQQEKISILLGPGINIKRSPLCGRNFEYFSEDPFLTAELASAMILGIQSKGVAACLKHFAANNQEKYRMTINSVIDERALHEIYLSAFERVIAKSNPWSLMTSYNKLNGEYTSESMDLIQGILRKKWNYQGVVMTDWGGVNDRVKALQAGVDLEMPSSGALHDSMIIKAVVAGRIPFKTLNSSVRRILQLVFFADSQKKSASAYSVEEHHLLAKKAACESIVLLKNNNQRLPLSPQLPLLPLKDNQTVALIGQFAMQPRFQGAGSSLIHPTRLDTVYQAAEAMGKDSISYAKGYSLTSDQIDPALMKEAKEVALHADVAIIMAGLPDFLESEGFDRVHMKLPPNHLALIDEISAVHPNVVVVLLNGAPVEMPWAMKVSAILECYLAGQAGQSALWDILTGAANPSGKLAETFPIMLEHTGAFPFYPMGPQEVEYREGIFVGYRYYDKIRRQVLFPFGHGLSYTTFRYSDPLVENSLFDFSKKKTYKVSVTIENTGDIAGYEIVQFYVKGLSDKPIRPEKELKGFEKVFLRPKEKKLISIFLDSSSFSYYSTPDHSWKIAFGAYKLLIGSSCADIRLELQVSVSSADTDELNHKTNELYMKKETNYFHHLFANRNVTQEEFFQFIGRKIPESIGTEIGIHRNSTLGECQWHWICRLLYKAIILSIRWMVKGNKSQMDTMTCVLPELPLRGLVLMSNGAFTYRCLDVMILWINRKRGKAIKRLFME